MADIVLVAVARAFFDLWGLYVHWCDRILGSDAIEESAPQYVRDIPVWEMAG